MGMFEDEARKMDEEAAAAVGKEEQQRAEEADCTEGRGRLGELYQQPSVRKKFRTQGAREHGLGTQEDDQRYDGYQMPWT
jgi:hypothetical protein